MIKRWWIAKRNKRKLLQALLAIKFIEEKQKQLRWSRKTRERWWRAFIKSPESRAEVIKNGLEEVNEWGRR